MNYEPFALSLSKGTSTVRTACGTAETCARRWPFWPSEVERGWKKMGAGGS